MKVKMPMMSVEARGAISGIEFRQGIYGPMVGKKSSATHQNTIMGLLHRSRLAPAHRAWEVLTDSNRAAWCAHATHPATGRNTFLAMCIRFTQAGEIPLTSPEPSDPPDPLKNLVIYPQALFNHAFQIQWTFNPLYDDLYNIFILPSYSGRQNPTISQLRFKAHLAFYPTQLIIYDNEIAPVYHVRLDQISRENGDLISRHLFRILNPGWTV